MSEIKTKEDPYKNYFSMCMLGYIQILRTLHYQFEIKNVKSMYSKKFLPSPIFNKMTNVETGQILFDDKEEVTPKDNETESKSTKTVRKLNKQFDLLTQTVEKEMNWKILRNKIAPGDSVYKDTKYPIQIEQYDDDLIDFDCLLTLFFNESDIQNELYSLSKENDDYFILEPLELQNVNQLPITISNEYFSNDTESDSSEDDINEIENGIINLNHPKYQYNDENNN